MISRASDGVAGSYAHAMYLNDHPPIAGGRELWGFPKKLASPKLETETDTLVGTLDYGSTRIARATMGFKHREVDPAVWKRVSIKSAAQCNTCHTQAEQGNFDEHQVRIPR